VIAVRGVPPGSHPTALVWCEVEDGATRFLRNSGEACDLAAVSPPARVGGPFGVEQPGAILLITKVIGEPATVVAVELPLDEFYDAWHRPRLGSSAGALRTSLTFLGLWRHWKITIRG
jgi:hypothetical protein